MIGRLAVCACLLATGVVAADSLGLHPDVTVASKYMAHGFNINGDHVSVQPSLHVDTKIPGLQLAAWAGLPADRDFRGQDEFDYLLKYNTTLGGDSVWAVKLNAYVDYWLYPNHPGAGEIDEKTGEVNPDLKGWKFNGGLSLPNLLPVGGTKIVPGYNYYYWTPQNEDDFEAGGVHEITLNCGVPVAGQSIDLGTSLNYHDGVFGVEPGWSHATAQVASTFKAGTAKITPSVNYQWSFEDSVNDEDEFWAALSVAADF